MQFRKYIFFAGLIILAGCDSGNESQVSNLICRMDSLNGLHTLAMDSLVTETQNLQGKIDQLKANNQILADSMANIKESQSKAKNGPKISPTIPRGDPIEIPIQNKKNGAKVQYYEPPGDKIEIPVKKREN
jgi:TolA-binding protein